jgi:uncharacterized phage protein (TIGR01671 family)
MELKFRAWDRMQHKMIHFDFENIYGYEGEVCGVILPDEQTALNYNSGYGKDGLNQDLEIMPFIGLQDKNKKDIYKGDIVRFYFGIFSDDPTEMIDEVGFDDGHFVFLCKEVNNYAYADRFNTICEVIGNIYENPELLNKVG